MAVEVGWASTQQRFRAMGTDCHIVVVGPDGARRLQQARRMVEDLEAKWSRFRPDSEISRLNSNRGRALRVSGQTVAVVERAIAAWRLTGGRFDPTVAARMIELGYDRSFEQLNPPPASPFAALLDGGAGADQTITEAVRSDRSIPGCEGIEIALAPGGGSGGRIALPPDVGLDLGGIGKGFAADLVAAETMTDGAWGVLVNLGGDLRVMGTPPSGDAWTVVIHEPTVGRQPLATVRLLDGGLATSTTRRRRWSSAVAGPSGGPVRHHLLDPDTGLPQQGGPQLVSVVAGQAWWAEAAATALAGCPSRPELPPGCSALQVDDDGSRLRRGDFAAYEVEPADPDQERA